jgi:hypothetical protein
MTEPRSGDEKREYRPATLVECLAVIKARLSDQLSPAEQRELQQAIEFIGGNDEPATAPLSAIGASNAGPTATIVPATNAGPTASNAVTASSSKAPTFKDAAAYVNGFFNKAGFFPLPHEAFMAGASFAQSSTNAPMPDDVAATYLDEGFSIKVLNPEHGNYWRCPHCDGTDKDGHVDGCLIRRLVDAARPAPLSAIEPAVQELRNIADAKRFDKERFRDDTEFADWAQSRARHTLARTETKP